MDFRYDVSVIFSLLMISIVGMNYLYLLIVVFIVANVESFYNKL